jgi:hypothetical protein
MRTFKELKQMKEVIGKWSIEYRPEVKQWEVMYGTGHYGLYDSRADAINAVDLGRGEE